MRRTRPQLVGVQPRHVTLVPTDGIRGTIEGAEDHGVEKMVTVSVADDVGSARSHPLHS